MLTGCQRWWMVGERILRGTKLVAAVVGFPSQTAQTMGQAIKSAVSAYGQAGRGNVQVEIVTSAVPPSTWFVCGSPAEERSCGPGEVDASLMASANLEVQILGGSGLPILVSGRTALGVAFGNVPLPTPTASPTQVPIVDIVVAYDVWAYWLGVLAGDMVRAWKIYDADTEGLPQEVFAHQFCPVRSKGLSSCGVPILRNPMVLQGGPARLWSGVSAEWTWGEFVSRVRAATAVTVGFSLSDYYPWAAEVALGMLKEKQVDVSNSNAMRAIAGVIGRTIADLGGPQVAAGRSSAQLTYMWSPFWGRGYGWGADTVMLPLPSWSSQPGAPCTYVLATVNADSPNESVAADFAFFLVSPRGQSAISSGNVGLLLRESQARQQLEMYYPFASTDAGVVRSGGDMTASQLTGAQMAGPRSIGEFYGAVDAFVQLLRDTVATPG